MAPGPARSIWSRKLDLLYLVFFITHIPIMLAIDLARYYPARVVPQFIRGLSSWYAAYSHDRLFAPSTTPAWFHVFLALEAVYHLPLSVWAVGALRRDDALLPLSLLVWAVETGLTTLVCCVDAATWPAYTPDERRGLAGLYTPYLLLALGMGLDMFMRVRKTLLEKAKRS